MKILIVGTGVIGVNYGWALSEAGNEVTHFVRPGKGDRPGGTIHLDVIDDRKGHTPAWFAKQTTGGARGKHNLLEYALKCTEIIAPADGYELILLPIHFYQMEETLQMLLPLS